MTLDEAIKNVREVAERIQKDADKQKGLNHGYYVWQSVNADKYRQIAEWLEELKKYREMNIVHCKDCKHWGTDIAGETENVKCCECGKYMVGANGYCVYGEKRRVQNE